MSANTNTVPMKQQGMIGLIIFFHTRKSPPMISAIAHVSPIVPPMLPISAFLIASAFTIAVPALSSARGVAYVEASTTILPVAKAAPVVCVG